ncbi:efflux RND transporter periplasmic adaptor subunit [Roseobacter fucihabitans]|uniref:efflux RND transporter periplasmic adaptor subunit n=1 Tax=Roseobacter fucihabitans TaxID=1537242 RepID=UPI00165340BC|nr:efflux RND transporter periplasmic adaptor subunit [Roseobacter litoralis]
MIFDNDSGASWPHRLAGIVCLILTLWMASGIFFPAAVPTPHSAVLQVPSRMTVAVQVSVAETVTRFFKGDGHTTPDRETVILAEMAGHVARVNVKKGQMVTQGDPITVLDQTQRIADLNRAQEDLARTVRDFETAKALLERGAATSTRLAQARAALAASRAAIATAQQGLAQTELVAPFGGRVEALSVNPGIYIQEGDEIARIVDNTPLTVSMRVPQQTRAGLRSGAQVSVQFNTGESRVGQITFLGNSADLATRTFLVEISFPNADGQIPAGISARMEVPIGDVIAHFVSPAILSLGDAGVLGIKTVDAENRVVFTPVEIALTQSDGIWVTGLPERVRLITVGQGFVRAGETVIPANQHVLTEVAQ